MADERAEWSADPRRDGLAAFVAIEDDRAGAHPGVRHIRALGTMYRFDVHHPGDVDTYPDRQRQEVRGMRGPGGRERRIAEGETWRFAWSWYLTRALRATTSFTHVQQFFASVPGGGPGGGPVLVTSLRRRGGRDLLELNAIRSGVVVGAADLGPLRSRWIGVEIEARFAAAPGGRVRWRITGGDGDAVVDVERGGLDLRPGAAGVSPKWGIYRSLKDAARLGDAHLLIKDLRARQVRHIG
ncbi:Tat pathway signal sequence domain protein [Actinomadura sp. LD22]|uniref:Tat pathway signal sequence domain protein n=1 Tax=Actinomadura physcomitrii TaxID=2650748 RepID=A0A6I4MD73_9ACTN|nr:Tat pathway signal sequence domain protein [Actinomadura physcomitrii]MWA01741.1 Tat pathway signal sequence domain protein [Actinomadura physcomitrii]